MRKFFIIQKIVEYVSRRKINFFLTTVLMIVTLYMASMVIHTYTKSVYYMIETKNVFSDEDILNIQIIIDEQESNDYFENVEKFLEDMEDKYGEEFGKFMYLNVNYTKEGENDNLDTLYIDKSSFDLCKVRFHRDKEVEDLLKKDKSLIAGYVSKDNLAKYPIGTILVNSNINTKTVIAGYFENDSTWAPSLLLHSSEATTDLNNYLVSEMDNNYFEFHSMFYGNVFNSIYLKFNTNHNVNKYKEEIRKLARDAQIKCYIFTIDEMIDEEKQENKTFMRSLGTMVVFALFVALSGILASYLADVGSWQKEIAIMYLNGVAPSDVYLIILLENLIKALLGITVAIYAYGHKLLSYDYEIYWHFVVPVLIFGTLICVTLFSYIAFKTIKQKDLLSIYGGSKL